MLGPNLYEPEIDAAFTKAWDSPFAKERIRQLGKNAMRTKERMAADVFNNAFKTAYYENGEWIALEDMGVGDLVVSVPKPTKLSVKMLVYLTPLLPLIAVLKNNSMSKRELFNPINWLKEKNNA